MSNSKFSNAILGRSVEEQQNVYCDASIILENYHQNQKNFPFITLSGNNARKSLTQSPVTFTSDKSFPTSFLNSEVNLFIFRIQPKKIPQGATG